MGREDWERLRAVDFSDPHSIERYALDLSGKTMRQIMAKGIRPDGYKEQDYSAKQRKGGVGNLIEECYFGYRSNNDERPDFPEAGVELKATCYDVIARNGRLSAGERLVITMIPYDREVTTDFFKSHLWTKCKSILLIYYERNRGIDTLDQMVKYVKLFQIPKNDLRIIIDDYKKIVSYIISGRADELSEGLTTYLGACTKGATAEKSWVVQFYPFIEDDGTPVYRKAKRRAFCLKRKYMDYILHEYFIPSAQAGERAERIVGDGFAQEATFDEIVTGLIGRFVGMSDREIANRFGLEFTGKKLQWATLAYKMLGIKGNRAEEFQKGNISVRAVRVREDGSVVESLSFANFKFQDLVDQADWDESDLFDYLDSTRFLFVVFKERDGVLRLKGSFFWSMPMSDIDGDAKRCWAETRETLIRGVRLEKRITSSGRVSITNDLPSAKDNLVMHVRPKAQRSAYLLADGTRIGNIDSDADRLPDGRYMTKQCFWINNTYIASVISSNLP